MRTHEIISWALRAIDQAKADQPYEDSRVEFKSIWIEPREAARHIAGHANAARGEPILWLMGVLPTGEVSGVLAMELANWYPQVKSFFDESAPELIDVNITIGEVTVVALLWNTEPALSYLKPAAATHRAKFCIATALATMRRRGRS